jgi:hypothetical protein
VAALRNAPAIGTIVELYRIRAPHRHACAVENHFAYLWERFESVAAWVRRFARAWIASGAG